MSSAGRTKEIERQGMRRLAFSARPILAGVVALLIVLQGFAALGSSPGRYVRGAGEASFVVSLLGVTCSVDAQGDNNSPSHEHGHASCCVLCGARNFEGVALADVGQILDVAIAQLQSSVWTAGRLPDISVRPQIGWVNSWSSQAPPYFS